MGHQRRTADLRGPFYPKSDSRAVDVNWRGFNCWRSDDHLVGQLTIRRTSYVAHQIYTGKSAAAPKKDESEMNLQGLVARYGGLTGLEGVDLGQDSVDRGASGVEVLRSRLFLSRLISRHETLRAPMASMGWNTRSNKIILDDVVFDASLSSRVRDVDAQLATAPCPFELSHRCSEALSVQPVPRFRSLGRTSGTETRLGDTIVVPRTFRTSVTQTLYQAATAVAGVETVND